MSEEVIDEEIEALLYSQVYYGDPGNYEPPTENLPDFGQTADFQIQLLPIISQENWTETLSEERKEEETVAEPELKEPSSPSPEALTKSQSEPIPETCENTPDNPIDAKSFGTSLKTPENTSEDSHQTVSDSLLPKTNLVKKNTAKQRKLPESAQSYIQAYRKNHLWTRKCSREIARFKRGLITENELFDHLDKAAVRPIPTKTYGLRGKVEKGDLISLDDSDGSDVEFIGITKKPTKMSKNPAETVVVDSSADEDELIFIPPPPVPVIAIEDESDGEIPLELEPPQDETSNDFLMPAPLDNPNFNFSLHGSEFQDQEFIRPVNPDADEYESSASTSDINRDFSNTIKTITFNEVEFPKDLFEENLDKFGELITPRRQQVEGGDAPGEVTEVSQKNKRPNTKTSSESSSESDYDTSETHRNLPELSLMIVEAETPKPKTKKKKKKGGEESETPDTLAEEEESKKKKKKKRLEVKKKKKTSSEEIYDEVEEKARKKKKKKTLSVDNDLDQEEEDGEGRKRNKKRQSEDSDLPQQVTEEQKKRRKKQSDVRESIDEGTEPDTSQVTEDQKKRRKRQSQDVEPFEETTEPDPTEDQKKRKKRQSQDGPVTEPEKEEDYENQKQISEDIEIPQSDYQEMAGEQVIVQDEEDEDVVIVEKPIPIHTINSESESSDDDILIDDVELSLANVEVSEDKSEKEDFDVNNILSKMSDDPQKWKILDADIYNMPAGRRGPRCHKCRQFGHMVNSCPTREQINCSLCGFEGHSDTRCPNKVCFTCGRPGDYSTVFCYRCSGMRKMVCQICAMVGHTHDNCPDLWRRYFLTTRDGPPVTSKLKKKQLLKPRDKLWCAGCASKGHLDHECRSYLREYPASNPYIFDYKDLYKNTSEPDLRNVLDKRRENPSTSSPRHQRLNPVSFLQRAPHESVLNPCSIVRPQVFPQVDPQILAGQLMAMAMQPQPPQYNAPMYGERYFFDFSRYQNEGAPTNQYQPTYTTPQMPTGDFIPLESAQQAQQPEHNIVVQNIDDSIKKKFISEDVVKLQKFVSQEIRKMDANRIRDVKQCKKRLNITCTLRKNTPSASINHQLYGLFRSINMHLFGVRKLAKGKEKLDFLRNFLSQPGKNLSGPKRQALLEAYGYIFGGEHPNFNYRKHINALSVKER